MTIWWCCILCITARWKYSEINLKSAISSYQFPINLFVKSAFLCLTAFIQCNFRDAMVQLYPQFPQFTLDKAACVCSWIFSQCCHVNAYIRIRVSFITLCPCRQIQWGITKPDGHRKTQHNFSPNRYLLFAVCAFIVYLVHNFNELCSCLFLCFIPS